MRRILEFFKGDWQWWVVLTICLSAASLFILCLQPWSRSNPRADIVRVETPDTGTAADKPPVPADDGLVMLHVRDTLPDKMFFAVPDGVKTTVDQTIVVMARKENGMLRYGSGFMFRKGMAITAAHIFDRDTKPYDLSVICQGRAVDAKIVAYDRARDLAIIEADCPGIKRRLDITPLDAGETLYRTGYTFSNANMEKDGLVIDRYVSMSSPIPMVRIQDMPPETFGPEVAAQLRTMKRRRLVRHQAITGSSIPGQSGSAVVRADGAIVGVLVFYDSANDRSFMVPAIQIMQLMNNHAIPY